MQKIKEIRVEEVHNIEEKEHFFRVYFHYADGKIKMIDESSTKPILARYVSRVYQLRERNKNNIYFNMTPDLQNIFRISF